MRTLLLLTHQFPRNWGDAAFVQNEIAALAEAFDEIRIISLWGDDEPTVPLPENCIYLGSVGRLDVRRALRGALSANRLGRLVRVVAGAVRTRSFRLVPDLRAAAVGMTIARRLEELQARRTADEPLTIYAFWGVDMAYALPWFAQPRDDVAIRLHRYDLDEESEGYRPLRRSVLGAADVLLTISEKAHRYVLDRYTFIPPQRVLVRRLGVAIAADEHAAPSTSGPTAIVSCSSVIPLKRVGMILEVVAEIARRGRAVNWVHFGDGPELDAVRARADALISELPALQVRFAGRVPTTQVLEHYRTSATALFLNLSTIEGVPVSAMEAAAFGIPIVATDVGATDELVGVDLGSGVLVAGNATVPEIADAVTEVLDSPGRFDPRAIWADRFDARRNAQRTASTLRKLNE